MPARLTHRPAAGACVAVALLVASLLSGCGSDTSDGSRSSASSVPEVLTICPTTPEKPWRAVKGAPVPAAALGSGPTVVFANMSDNNPCNWLTFAQNVAGSGYRAVVFSYTDPTEDGEKQAVSETVKLARKVAHGSPYALVGASLGGRVVIEAASWHAEHLAGIVSLSGETVVDNYGDITGAAREVTTPALYIGATHDDLTKGTTQQDALHAAMHGSPNLLLQVPGSDHGIALLDGTSSGKVTTTLMGFLRKQLPTSG